MKKLALFSCLFFIAVIVFSQTATHKIILLSPDNKPTDARFYIILGTDTLTSDAGMITISDDMYKKYENKLVRVYFNDDIVFRKLYRPPFNSAGTPLHKLCVTTKLVRR